MRGSSFFCGLLQTPWRESLATCGKDCLEQWAAHYAGSLPGFYGNTAACA